MAWILRLPSPNSSKCSAAEQQTGTDRYGRVRTSEYALHLVNALHLEHGGRETLLFPHVPPFRPRVLELHRKVPHASALLRRGNPGTETKWKYRNMPAGATRRRVGIFGENKKKIPHSQVRSTAASAAAQTDGERGPRKIPRSPAAVPLGPEPRGRRVGIFWGYYMARTTSISGSTSERRAASI